ncbi:protein FADD [Callorhinchus milii]|uniref:Fas (TNFRSF6)-associated via death domain protein n=1 Tax=Callorhinchus milii TaxID=7868 RepID=V9KZJ8_CALMI|nr:protein FADD [Callorhinchus milii]|eukprot:gi/632941535/ref/XP_007885916.1/ PREDICTED: FAS-associated death domain protein [Callorhinchus milii]
MEFQVLLNDVSRQLTSDNLEAMKFLCQRVISKSKREAITDGLGLLETLQELDLLAQDDTAYLCRLLGDVKRLDLRKRVQAFAGPERERLNSPVCETGGHTGCLDDAFDVICDNIGKDWRLLARRLGITDVQLQQIEYRYPFNMREQVMQCLKEWHKMKGKDANIGNLVQTLRQCKLNMVADNVEEQVKKSS